jgi:long-chain acyl-CoA synthetase
VTSASAPPVERVTAAQSDVAQRRCAGALARRGVATGDRVAVVAGPSATYLATAIGALRSGVIPVLLNPALTASEQATLLADAEPHLVLRDDDLPALLDGPPIDLAPVPLGRPMMYTSGTTGTPKGVFTGVLGADHGAALVAEERDMWGFAADDVHVVVSALYHSAPLRFAMGTLLAGGDVVLLNGFDAERWRGAIAEHRPTSAFCAPTHLQRLFELGQLPSLSSFRLIAHAGAPCPTPLKRHAIEAFPTGSVWEFYGSTEGQFTACSTDEWHERPGTVGRARPGRRLSIDADTNQIWCEVPPHARFTYWRAPEKTAAAWRGDAFSVGDIGSLDADGYLYLDGRRNDLIITGGVNVYPLEIERVLLDHPAVREVVVYPVADERWGQMVCAAYVGDVGHEALTSWLAERVAPYKRPKQWRRVEHIPTTATGKVRRSTLAADLV